MFAFGTMRKLAFSIFIFICSFITYVHVERSFDVKCAPDEFCWVEKMKSRLQHFFQIPIYVYDSRQRRRDGWLVRTKVEISAVRSASETRSRRCLADECVDSSEENLVIKRRKNERVFRVTQFHFSFGSFSIGYDGSGRYRRCWRRARSLSVQFIA